MTRKIALATASLFALSALAGPALAGGSKTEAGGSAGVSAPSTSAGADTKTGAQGGATTNMSSDSMSTDKSVTGAVGGTVDVGSAVSAIGSDSASEIGTMTEVSSVKVVKLDELGAEAEAKTQLDAAVTDNAENIASLQAAIESNTALKSKLDAENVEASDVVATETEADGSLTVFVQ